MLTSGGVQALPELVLVAGPGTDNNDGDVCCLRGSDGLIKTGLVARPALATLCESSGYYMLVRLHFVYQARLTSFACSLDSIVGGNSVEVASVYYIITILYKY